MSCDLPPVIRSKRLIVTALAAGLIGGAAIAAAPLAVLAKVERGRWQFKVIGAALGRDVCAPDPLRLVQFNHPGPGCTRFTIEDAADHVTIQYNCGPRGYGKTTIKLTQPGQIRLDTQGIDPTGRPFDSSYEGRYAGACAPPPR